jgi:hypothetical protein
MTEYDSNMIKPVDGLQNITRLNPAKRREERKPKQHSYEQNKEESESNEDKSTDMFDESTDQEGVLTEGAKKQNRNRDSDVNGIDFCA